ncbi:MAG: iron-containing alcohol dehydrogenase [Bryobacterales bacterium]|jgi:alcohol dehydrogenase class IV|nr:iron-containing alcohol dehydrogenase [Bryobacterales bacterium]
MRFEFASATRIVFGEGCAQQAVEIARTFGARILLVCGRDPRRAGFLVDALGQSGVAVALCSVHGEPTIEFVRQAVAEHAAFQPRAVVAIGGGSVLDAGKAISALLANAGDVLRYLEVIGEGQALPNPALPVVAIPTTAGTGSEVTRNAVLGSAEHGVKASLRSPGMLPAVALVDPRLTLDLPAPLTASTGLDALTQVLEPYVCARANPLTDLYCEEGMRQVARWLRKAVTDGQDLPARTGMALASLLGGLALANAGLGVVHAFAAPVGGAFPAPHGAVCAAILPHGLRANLEALRRSDAAHPMLARFTRMAALLTGIDAAQPEQGIAWVEGLVKDLGIPGLARYGVTEQHLPPLAEKALRTSSMKANPVLLDVPTMLAILRASL